MLWNYTNLYSENEVFNILFCIFLKQFCLKMYKQNWNKKLAKIHNTVLNLFYDIK